MELIVNIVQGDPVASLMVLMLIGGFLYIRAKFGFMKVRLDHLHDCDHRIETRFAQWIEKVEDRLDGHIQK